MKSAVALAFSTCLLLGGCATPADSKRSRLVVPSDLGAIYSDVEMQARLAFVPEAPSCQPLDCTATEEFRGRVRQLTERLMPAAMQLAREEKNGIPRMTVSVPGKSNIGTLSSASGSIVVFDGLRTLGLSDPALAFVIAREMGHVIGKHHEENTATGLAVSVSVALLFPLAGILQGLEAAYTASTLASTATSFAGARAVRAFYEEDQRLEADTYALTMLTHAGWPAREVAHAVREAAPRYVGDGWMAELRDSQRWLDGVAPPSLVEVDVPGPEAVTEPLVSVARVVTEAAATAPSQVSSAAGLLRAEDRPVLKKKQKQKQKLKPQKKLRRATPPRAPALISWR